MTNDTPSNSGANAGQKQEMSLGQALEIGLKFHNAGRLDEAENIYRQIVAAAPQNDQALCFLGVIAQQRGDRQSAVDLLSKSLRLEPKNAVAHANLGSVCLENGDVDAAIGHLQRAIQINPGLAEAEYNLGRARLQAGNAQAALTHFAAAKNRQPNLTEARIGAAEALVALGRPSDAIADFREAMKQDPASHQARLGLIGALTAIGEYEQAIEACNEALRQDASNSQYHFAKGRALGMTGRLPESAASCRQGLTFDEKNAQEWNRHGSILAKLERLHEAVESFDKAIAIDPRQGEIYANKANALSRSDKHDEAENAFTKALELSPTNPYVRLNYAFFLEKTNRIEELRAAVSAAKEVGAVHDYLALPDAHLLMRDGENKAARDILEKADFSRADHALQARRLNTLGKACDRLRDFPAAFEYFSKCKQTQQNDPLLRHASAARYQERIQHIAEACSAENARLWRRLEDVADDRRDPVFVFSFPRSGTTLLDSMLRGHAHIETIEEKPFVGKMSRVLEASDAGLAESLRSMDRKLQKRLRDEYYAHIDSRLGRKLDDATTLIDRHPFHTIHIGVIRRAFPTARLVFIARRPCDCIMSCFMQSFRFSDETANLLDLESATALYDQVMRLWEQYNDVFELDAHFLRYEDLVVDAEKELRALTSYLRLDWDGNVLRHVDSARERREIKTASYAQVTQPLYTRSIGRWKHYSKHLEPVLPTLLKWAERFGYEE